MGKGDGVKWRGMSKGRGEGEEGVEGSERS